jgi:drug/metabolite transporter (DMT)-like permease
MTWLLAGIIPPVLWALVNHVDKHLLSRTTHKSSVDVLMVYSTWFSLLVLPILFFFSHEKLFQNSEQVIFQIIGGILLTFTVYFYLKALDQDEASVVMPLALLVPVFGFVFSYFILGEMLTIKQAIACILIISGSLILTLEFSEERRFKMKYKVLAFMIAASAFQAMQEILFKYVSVENSFKASFFWLHVGIALCGFTLVIMKKGLFADFVGSVKINGRLMFGFNLLSESFSAVAYLVQNYALLLAPVAVIMTLNGYQPVFVFIFGIVFTVLLPKFVKENIGMKHLFHKGLAIGIILIGTILIVQTISS